MSIRINSTFAGGAVIAGIFAGFVFGNLLPSAADADAARIPDFASDPSISWSLEGGSMICFRPRLGRAR